MIRLDLGKIGSERVCTRPSTRRHFFLSSFSGVGHFFLEKVMVFISFSSAPLEDYDKKVILFVV